MDKSRSNINKPSQGNTPLGEELSGIIRVGIAADHGGFPLKEQLAKIPLMMIILTLSCRLPELWQAAM
jgi:hypothetical protein